MTNKEMSKNIIDITDPQDIERQVWLRLNNAKTAYLGVIDKDDYIEIEITKDEIVKFYEELRKLMHDNWP